MRLFAMSSIVSSARWLKFLLLPFMLTAVGCASAPVDCVSNPPRVMIIGQQEGDALPTSSGAYQRLERRLAAALTGEGYQVMDAEQAARDFPEYFRTQRLAHDNATLATMLRSTQPAPDLAVVMAVTADARSESTFTQIESAMRLRVVGVNSAKTLAQVEVETQQPIAVRPNCSGECLENGVVDSAKTLVAVAAAELAPHIACGSAIGVGARGFDQRHGSRVTGYEVDFEGFTVAEVAELEAMLETLGGYRSHRVTYTDARKTTYWYETSMGSATLQRNLNVMAQRAGLRAYVEFSGNRFSLRKVVLRSSSTVDDGLDTDAKARRAALNDW